MLVYRTLLFAIALGMSLAGCTPATNATEQYEAASAQFASTTISSDEFGEYWYQGDAELTSYHLQQARYGEMHEGHAVLIYVTEDFSKKKQVKLDNPGQAGDDKINVLKLNATKKFNTGIYPYSMMASVFTPIQGASFPRTLKVTTSSQEWCGHTYTQINKERNKYRVEGRSYFEREGDQDVTLKGVMLEDEVWTAIRLDPDLLPTGSFDMIPGTMYQRLGHIDFGVVKAEAQLTEQENEMMTYTLSYPSLNRKIAIHFNKAFPYEIEGWEESTTRGNTTLTTTATRNKRMMLDYWSRNGVADLPLRAELGLD